MSVAFGIQGSGQLVGEPADPGLVFRVARAAEAVGFDSLWAGDHISFHNPILDVVVALTAFAAVTERVTIGAGVVLLPVRPPVLVARSFASLDHVSGGRVIIGIGAGGEGQKDFEAVGVPISERGARTNEAMLALRQLFSSPEASFRGRFFSFDRIKIQPGPAQQGGPPLWVGGRSDAAIQRAGQLGDGWLPVWVSPESFARGWMDVRRYAEDAGRDADDLTPAVTVPARVGTFDEAILHLSERYRTRFERHHIERYCLVGPPSACVARIHDYIEAGVRHMVFLPAAAPSELIEQVRLLGEIAHSAARRSVDTRPLT